MNVTHAQTKAATLEWPCCTSCMCTFATKSSKCLKCRRRRRLQDATVHGKSCHHEGWCPVCDRNLGSDQRLRQHVKNKHSRESRAQKNFSPITDNNAAAVLSDVNFEAHHPSFVLPELGSLSVQTTDEAYRAVDAILEFMTWNQPELLIKSRTKILYELSMHLEDAALNGNRSTFLSAQHPWFSNGLGR